MKIEKPTLILFFYISGYFPMGAGMCVIWATMDVLLCTASIWHMCTMSMDRYFTLKYPMKYGRNKTTSMVVTKILFVWIVSISISSPVCILGFLDNRNVYNDNMCVPTIRSFIIYGSIFAFYIPLFIMVLTYALTIRILCVNQSIMRKIVNDHSSKHKHRKENNGPLGATYLAPDTYIDRNLPRPSMVNSCVEYTITESASHDAAVIMALDEAEQDTSRISLLDSTPLKEQNPLDGMMECKRHSSLTDSHTSQGNVTLRHSCDFDATASESQMSIKDMFNTHYEIPRFENTSFDQGSLGSNKLDLSSHRQDNKSLSSINSAFSGYNYGDNNEANDIFEKLSQIEQEMDDCLQDRSDSKSDNNSSSNLLDIQDNIIHEDVMKSVEDSKNDANNSNDRKNSNDSSNLVTIELKPNGCYLYSTNYNDNKPPNSERRFSNASSFLNEQIISDDNLDDSVSGTFSTSTVGTSSKGYSSSSTMFVNKKHKIYRKQSIFSHIVHTHEKKKAPYLISKRTASNEKKASKVLGIIFAVFLILWTPFFIANIIAAVCETCITTMTPSIMASIVWLGYLSSLANPIIYTMFNTAFRRAFVKILTCQYQQQKPMLSSDILGFTNTSHWGERRNTVTISLKEL